MSEAVEAAPVVVEAPVVAAPAEVKPLGALESVAEYRERRDKGDTGEPVEAKPAAVVEPVAAVEPDPASEAGKALAAKRGSLQDRINALTAEKHETLRREAALRAELEAAKGGKPAAEPAQVVDPNDPEPDVNSFEDYAKYVKAQARWEARQEFRAQQATAQQAHEQQHAATRQTQVEATATAAHPDFVEVVSEFAGAGHAYSPASARVILHHPLGHEVAYALAKDPALNARLNAAPDAMVFGIEMGRIIAGLEGKATAPAAAPAVPAVSKAPAPVKTVGGTATASSVSDPAKISSVAEWNKVRKNFA